MNMKNVKKRFLRFLRIVIMVCGVVSGSVEEGEGWGSYTHDHLSFRVAAPFYLDFNYVITPGWLGIWPYVSGNVMADIRHPFRYVIAGGSEGIRFSKVTHDTAKAHDFTYCMFNLASNDAGKSFAAGWKTHKCSDMTLVHLYASLLGFNPESMFWSAYYYFLNDVKTYVSGGITSFFPIYLFYPYLIVDAYNEEVTNYPKLASGAGIIAAGILWNACVKIEEALVRIAACNKAILSFLPGWSNVNKY
jgi:hypothetical protein